MKKIPGVVGNENDIVGNDGWFRIIESNRLAYVPSVYPIYMDILLQRSWNNNVGEVHKVKLAHCGSTATVFKDVYFIPEYNQSNLKLILNIRCYAIRYENDTYQSCIDIQIKETAKGNPIIVQLNGVRSNRGFIYNPVETVFEVPSDIQMFGNAVVFAFKNNSIGYNEDTWPLT